MSGQRHSNAQIFSIILFNLTYFMLKYCTQDWHSALFVVKQYTHHNNCKFYTCTRIVYRILLTWAVDITNPIISEFTPKSFLVPTWVIILDIFKNKNYVSIIDTGIQEWFLWRNGKFIINIKLYRNSLLKNLKI